MRYFVAILAIAAVVLAGEKYIPKFDNVEVQDLIRNDRLVQNYVNCALDKGTCTADGTVIKKNLPEALKNNCSKCSEKKDGIRQLVKHIYEHKPEWFKSLEEKFDKEGIYRKKYQEADRSRG